LKLENSAEEGRFGKPIEMGPKGFHLHS
jgi:hypothetical protein